ncbi:hypothetical protein ACONUD_19385 [Microbulbifer harenosus]|uniref:Uncharacterized protein n=2 Tax=Microbulbifer TaxID=48073 RepID=A0ABY2UDR3_9GAMM|nr:hypothetical protein [Microbulbifer harenosus]QIL90113.1 hypothetical protein GNX18_10360 [Microbulbifer sp. SH-1]TLM74421.1 hypothetical protein FDY93_17380 [Microbulbifer harenosus]
MAAGNSNDRPFHMRRWLSIQQAVDHLSALSEEPLTSDDLARLAEDHLLDLYWYRPGQMLSYIDLPEKPRTTLKHPLRLSPEHSSDWRAIVGVLRQRPALPAEENDTPTLQDTDGNRLRIAFDFSNRPEPFSSHWYPNYSELVVKRRDLDRLERELFSSDDEQPLAPDLLLDVIWQLEQMAMQNGQEGGAPAHDLDWLTHELCDRSHLDPVLLGRVLNAAERQHSAHH